MTQHTWHFEMQGVTKDWPSVVNQSGNLIARTYGPGAEDHARLIAAAPALLAALEALTEWGREHTSPRDSNSPHELLVTAVAAIAQAKVAGITTP